MNEGDEREKCGGGRRILAGNWGRGRFSQIRLGGCTDRASTSLAMVVMQALGCRQNLAGRWWPPATAIEGEAW
ncbi:hypothetical protein DCAR_0415302 [Daucus carota subsp. sativus]|uniref:Uncharacterized protein n=1 Tax=Daucus carota subsp. sativus TaxID=79200 RepID=A0A162A8U9_DAUCS|nr:hypothetical protein DCAR_0415302 [Daucus carota subsp. sativus]